MCGGGDGQPGDYAEALKLLAAGLDFLNTVAPQLPESALGEVLLGLEAAASRQVAARAAVLGQFDAVGAHDRDGYQNSSSWLRDKAGMSRRPPGARSGRCGRCVPGRCWRTRWPRAG